MWYDSISYGSERIGKARYDEVMRSKSRDLMMRIKSFAEQYYRENHTPPSTQIIGNAVGVTKQTVRRYLTEMSENGILEYDRGIKSSPQIAKCKTNYISVPVVGSIRCGNPETEEGQVEEYVSLPASVFGSGKYYLVKAKGDSMVDAGIEEGDYILVELIQECCVGDIVVALDSFGENTLKRYAGQDKKTDEYILEYMNMALYPDKTIRVKSFVVQGVARRVIREL